MFFDIAFVVVIKEFAEKGVEDRGIDTMLDLGRNSGIDHVIAARLE